MGKIYIFTSPSGKSYVGQTTRDIEERFGERQLNYDSTPISRCARGKQKTSYGFVWSLTPPSL